jgi:hypothetical protein
MTSALLISKALLNDILNRITAHEIIKQIFFDIKELVHQI